MKTAEITAGSRVTAKGGLLATVISTKGRWVKVKFDHDGAEKNVGFKDITPVKGGDNALPKNGVVNPACRARYVTTKIDGVTHVDSGDEVAAALRGVDLDDVYKIAADVLQTTQKELRTKYEHLNVGQQRMNLGNRLRKAVRDNPANLKFIR